MKHRFPLYLKIVLWFFLNLLLLGIGGSFFFAGQFGLDLLVSGPVAARIAVASEAISSELRTRSISDWNAILENRSSAYGVKFVLFKDDGTQLAGEPTALPQEVKQNLRGPLERLRRWFGEGRFHSNTNESPDRPPPEMAGVPFHHSETSALQSGTNSPFRLPPPSRPRFVLRTAGPTRYWVGMPVFLGEQGDGLPRFCTLLVVSTNLYGGGLFFDVKPIAIAGGCVLLFSVLFWFPLVRGITHSLAKMTAATERIAQGGLDVRVRIRRRDELGQLGDAVDRMAQRLQGFVTGQKRFLGDTAHELCTPLARIQMVVGILEQRADETSRSYVQDLREEVQHMSGLVSELLSFSKAALAGPALKLQPVKVRDIIRQAVAREAKQDSDIKIEIENEPEAMGDPDLLQRALANLIRNAVRYAGDKGLITISCAREADKVLVKVTDCGPGVSEQFLQRVFDPFFRVDEARTRESGGVGLGLTIVKTCVEACNGTVSCRNRQPSGFEVVLKLKEA